MTFQHLELDVILYRERSDHDIWWTAHGKQRDIVMHGNDRDLLCDQFVSRIGSILAQDANLSAFKAAPGLHQLRPEFMADDPFSTLTIADGGREVLLRFWLSSVVV